MCVCVSVTQHLTYQMFICPTNDTTYVTGNEGQNICGVFSENTSSIVWLLLVGHFVSFSVEVVRKYQKRHFSADAQTTLLRIPVASKECHFVFLSLPKCAASKFATPL